MRTYKEHYEKSREVSNVAPDLKSEYPSLYELSVDEKLLDTNEKYYDLIRKISEKIAQKLDSEPDSCYDTEFATYVDKWHDVVEISDLANLIMPQIESKVFHSNLKIEYVMPYRNKKTDSNLTASWLWHYDDCPPEYLKLAICLNETTEKNGCFQHIRSNGRAVVLPSSRFSPGGPGQQFFPGSRVPEGYVKRLLEHNGQISSLIGPQGTYALFTPNVIHRATIPQDSLNARVALFFFIRPTLKKEEFINETTKSITSTSDVKRYKLD